MSKINLTPNASGTGVFTIASPNSNTDRTLTLPDESGTILTTSSSVGVDGITSNATGTAITIDANNYVSTPSKPIISGQIGSAASDPAGDQLIPFNEFWVSQGITYNSTTRRFTVPVGGFYRITLNPFKKTGGAVFRVFIGVNNDAPLQATHYGQTYTSDTNYDTGNLNSVVELSANDYIIFRLYQGTIYNIPTDKFNQFSIELIG